LIVDRKYKNEDLVRHLANPHPEDYRCNGLASLKSDCTLDELASLYSKNIGNPSGMSKSALYKALVEYKNRKVNKDYQKELQSGDEFGLDIFGDM